MRRDAAIKEFIEWFKAVCVNTSSVADVHYMFMRDKLGKALDAAYAAGMREAADVARDHACDTWPELCNCSSKIGHEIDRLAQQADGGSDEHEKQD